MGRARKWISGKNGTRIFFLYEESDHWYVEYEAGAEFYGDVESQPLNLRGFTTAEEGKKAAEEYSKDLEEPFDLELPEEE